MKNVSDISTNKLNDISNQFDMASIYRHVGRKCNVARNIFHVFVKKIHRYCR